MKGMILSSAFVVVCACAVATPAGAASQTTQVCTGGAASSKQISTGDFVKVEFQAKCSANIFMTGIDASSTVYAVGAGSAKGKKAFTGNTAGGAVKAMPTDCPSGGCTATESGAAATQGVTDASST